MSSGCIARCSTSPAAAKAAGETIEEMQALFDRDRDGDNHRRPHQDRGMKGRTPDQAFKQGLPKPQAMKGEQTPITEAA